MTKADLVEKVAEKTGLTRTDVAVVVDSFLDTVKKSLESGGGKIVRDDRWGMRTLAYEIKKQAQEGKCWEPVEKDACE